MLRRVTWIRSHLQQVGANEMYVITRFGPPMTKGGDDCGGRLGNLDVMGVASVVRHLKLVTRQPAAST